MATNPDQLFADLIPNNGSGKPAVYGAPKIDDKEPPTTWRTLTAAEASTAGLTPGKIWQTNSKGETKQIGDAAPDALISPTDKEDLKAEALAKIRLGANLLKRSKEGWFATGFGSGVASMAGGTEAYDVKQDTATLKNAGALQRIIELNKKTGKNPLTPLSNSDFEALANSIANLDTSQSDENYQRNVRTVLDIYKRTYSAAGGDPADVDKLIKEAGIDLPGVAPSAPGTGGGDTPPGISEMTPEQQAKDKAFLATRPSSEQYQAFLSGLLSQPIDAEKTAARLKAAQEGGGYSGAVDESAAIRQQIDRENNDGLGNSAATTLAKQGGTLNLSDEAAGVGNALSNVITSPFSGKFDPVGSYRFGRDVERQRVEDARQQLGYGGSALEFVTGATSAGPAAALETLAPKAAAVAAGKAGAAGGALAGFGAGEGTDESVIDLGAGALFGYGVGRYGSAALDKASALLPRRLRAPQGLAPDVAEAADRQNVSLIRPMVDEQIMSKFEKLKGTENAGPIIASGAQRTQDDIEAAVIRLGDGGNATSREAQGEALRTIAQGMKSADREGTTAAYEAARSVQPDAMVDPATMRQRIDAKLSGLAVRPNQNRAEIIALKRYRADLDKPLPLQEIRTMRTDAYDNIYGSMSRSAEQRRADRFMVGVIDGANKDIEAALTPEALAAYKSADAMHRENKTLYKQAFKPLFGDVEGNLDKLSAEQIHDRFKRAINTNGQAIAAFHRRMPLEQSRDFAATIAEKLGRSAPDAPFDPQTFLTQTKDFSPSALRTMFGPGGELAVSDLRLLSRRLVDTGALKVGDATRAGYLERQGWRQLARAFIGGVTGLLKSGAGVGAAGLTGGAGYAGGGMAGAVAAGGTAATIAGGREVSRVLTARAMVSPRVAKWLAQTADITSKKAAQEQARKLSIIIGREPAIANDLQPVYDFLAQRLDLPLAANPDQGSEGNNE